MKKTFKPMFFALATAALMLTSSKAQSVVDSSFLDSLGTNNVNDSNAAAPVSGGYITSANISQSFTDAADDDLIVAELTYRNSGSNPGVPTSLSFDGVTLGLGSFIADNTSSYHDVGIYYAYVTPGTVLTGNVTGTLGDTTGAGYSLSIFGVRGINTTVTPVAASGDGGNNLTESVNVASMSGDITFAAAITGINAGSAPGLTLSTSDAGAVLTTSSTTTGTYAGNSGSTPAGAPTAEFVNGYFNHQTGTSTDTFTDTSSPVTGGKNDLAILEFQATPEPSTWAMLIGGFGLLLAVQTFRRQRQTNFSCNND